jgi:hypothetical protein
MPGMGTGSGAGNSTIVGAFHDALGRQGALIFLILVLLVVAWNGSGSDLPLGSSSSAASATTVLIPMGHLDDPATTLSGPGGPGWRRRAAVITVPVLYGPAS